MSYTEKTGIRDASLSKFHRTLPRHWYMNDIDQTVATYNISKGTKCIALIEEKHSNIKNLDLNSFQLQVLQDLAGEHRPVFVLLNGSEYKDHMSFYIISVNQAAKDFMLKNCKKTNVYLSEVGYYNFECLLRGEDYSDPPIHLSSVLTKFSLPEIL